jgi:hypothetical protein
LTWAASLANAVAMTHIVSANARKTRPFQPDGT